MAKAKGEFIATVPDIDIADSVAHFSAGEDFSLYMPLPIARRFAVRLSRVLAQYDAQKAQIVPLRKRRRPP